MATAVTKTPSTELSESGDVRIHLAVLSTLASTSPRRPRYSTSAAVPAAL